MRGMRRLLASVAFVAGMLTLPATASAVGTPLLSTAAFTNGPRVLTWTDVPDAVAYRVLRAPADCSNPVDISGVLGITPPPQTYSDTAALSEGVYCYIVEAQGLLPSTLRIHRPSWSRTT